MGLHERNKNSFFFVFVLVKGGLRQISTKCIAFSENRSLHKNFWKCQKRLQNVMVKWLSKKTCNQRVVGSNHQPDTRLTVSKAHFYRKETKRNKWSQKSQTKTYYFLSIFRCTPNFSIKYLALLTFNPKYSYRIQNPWPLVCKSSAVTTNPQLLSLEKQFIFVPVMDG